MRLQLNLKTITAQKPVANQLLIKIIVNGTIQFKSDWSNRTKKDNIFPFYEKNIITIPQDQLNYIKFQIRNEKKYLITQKTVLKQQAKSNTQIDFNIGKDKIRLKYTLIQTIPDDQNQLSFKKKSSAIEVQPQIMKSKQGRLQISKLGSNVYHFSQRLDPVIWLYDEFQEIISWKSPSLTLITGVILTLVIMNLKISLLIIAVCLIFGKNILIRKIQKINKKKNVHKRLFVPKDNYVFLQTCMRNYNQLYEKIHEFCLNEDKTQVISLINHICKASFLIFILLFIFSIQKLIVIALWSLLLLASPSGIKMFKQFWPSFLFFQKQTQKVTDMFTGYLKLVIGKNQQNQKQVLKQFYFYQYQRWFMGKGWSKPIGILQYHWADEDWRIQVLPKTQAPDGWVWITNHQIQYLENADQHGYQYTNDLSKVFNEKSSFATVRRRKFIRKCKLQTPVNILNSKRKQSQTVRSQSKLQKKQSNNNNQKPKIQ